MGEFLSKVTADLIILAALGGTAYLSFKVFKKIVRYRFINHFSKYAIPESEESNNWTDSFTSKFYIYKI